MTPTNPPNREPGPTDRMRDAERTKRKLLEAGLEEFARHGFAGARVGDIAAGAGVNKQLISYYFGGKEGLYREMHRSWQLLETAATDTEVPIAEMMRWYLKSCLADPRGTRLSLWRGLSDDSPDTEAQSHLDAEQRRLRVRQERGEIASEFDLPGVQMAWMGMVMAPIAFPQLAEKLFGVAVDSPEFEQRYSQTLCQIIHRLAEATDSDMEGTDDR